MRRAQQQGRSDPARWLGRQGLPTLSMWRVEGGLPEARREPRRLESGLEPLMVRGGHAYSCMDL